MKRCGRCGELKPFAEFKRAPRNRDGLTLWCVECKADYDREFRSTPYHKAKKQEQHRRKKLARYGMTPEDYEEMRESQEGLCAICKKPPSYKPPAHGLVVDHDHRTGYVRGLLCFKCNAGLGSFNDDFMLLHEAKEYLLESAMDQEFFAEEPQFDPLPGQMQFLEENV